MPRKVLPEPADVLEMEPEELAPFVLRHLQSGSQQDLSRYNFTLDNDQSLHNLIGPQKAEQYSKRLMEAWTWLEREGLLAPNPGDSYGTRSFITRKGERVLESEDFSAYVQSSIFPTYLDPVLTRHVKPLFVRGEFDTAVFRAFKEVEIRVRKKAALTNDDYGIDLMKKAFGPNGPLADTTSPRGEQDRTRELFTGALGIFKNPASHREVRYDDPREAIDVICFANQLLRMIERSGEVT